jgi:hypothetical protein
MSMDDAVAFVILAIVAGIIVKGFAWIMRERE